MKMLIKYRDAFSLRDEIGECLNLEADIKVIDDSPFFVRPFPISESDKPFMDDQMERLVSLGILSKSSTSHTSPVMLITRKLTKDKRPVVDFRLLNTRILRRNTSVPLMSDVLSVLGNSECEVVSCVDIKDAYHIYARLRGSQIFSTFDLRSGYHHMELSPEARAKSAFVTPLDKFEFTRCLFGLSQAPAYFQRLINKVIKGLPFAFGYLNDVLIHSPDIETHLQHIRILFQRLREADLKLKDSKCNYFKTHVQYLGHLVSGKGIKPLPEKLESVKKMPAPTTPKEIKQFLGLVGYYRKFIPRFADIARPMTNLTKQDVPFEWTLQCQASFEMLKDALITSPILKYPDPNKSYTLFTDGSKHAWACVLTQEYEHEKDNKTYKINHLITFASGLFKGSQLNWAALTKEAFAIYSSIKKLSYYLEDADIVLRSAHLPLKKFLHKNTLNTKVNNWAVEISPIEYILNI